MDIKTIEWKAGRIKIIDQTMLPGRLEYLYLSTTRELWRAIRQLQVRGAPALGAAAAYGVCLGLKKSKARDVKTLRADAERIIAYLASSRPTARNLFWALERMRRVFENYQGSSVWVIKDDLLKEAQAVAEEDRASCRAIGEFGAQLLNDGDAVLTICNAGALATIDYGTALGVIYRAVEQKKKIKVYACETRPLLQGARLTTWELKKKKIEVTLLCDSMAASLMKQGRISTVIAGADRVAANGDAANKIGTYSLAVLSRYHGIPFYIASPVSTFDISLSDGSAIPIEQRNAEEVTSLFFKRPVAPRGVKIYNPAFDITPHKLITALITDKGVLYPPFYNKIAQLEGIKR